MAPYYSDADVTLYCGDMREVLPTLDIAPDLVLADPPYGETSLAWDRWPEGWPAVVAKVASSLWCFGSLRMFMDRRAEFTDWRLSQDVVWEKHNGSGLHPDRFRRVHELAAHWYRGNWASITVNPPRETVAYVTAGSGRRPKPPHFGSAGKGGPWVDDGTRLARSILRAPSMWRRGAIHPTEKPVGILRPLIEYACPAAGLVLDPFAGSCSTGVAARLLGRRAVLIEADEAMCEKAAQLCLAQGVLPLGVSQ